jgi:hypothetical protein
LKRRFFILLKLLWARWGIRGSSKKRSYSNFVWRFVRWQL